MNSDNLCYVAFLDILGFKQLVESNEHNDLVRKYKNLLIPQAAMAVTNGEYKVVESSSTQMIAVPDYTKAKIKAMVISDSVLMYTEDDSMQSFMDICVSVGRLVMMGFFVGLPMRGSIAIGPLSTFNQQEAEGIFEVYGLLGMSLVKAYSNESRYEWAGCVLDDECVERYEQLYSKAKTEGVASYSINDILKHGFLIRYRPPSKDEQNSEQYVINWPKFNRSLISENTIQRSFMQHGKNIQNESAKRKLKNTLEFLIYSNSKRSE